MSESVQCGKHEAVDGIQRSLTNYACALNYDGLSADAVHAAKARVIDTLGALIGGFFGEPCRIARNLAARMPNAGGATVIGTRMKTAPDMAAFVNGTTARYVEMNDVYHWPGAYSGHPSDVVAPLLAAAEHAQVDGRAFITAIVLAYEVYQRICDVFHNQGFDHTTFCCLSTALGVGTLWRFTSDELAHCIAMAVVPNNILRQVRKSHLSMYKAAATGQAARAGVFAAMLARAGMQGPHLPFEGKAGWCEHVALQRFSLDAWGGNGTPFQILKTRIKHRPASAEAISSILAAEKIAPLKAYADVSRIAVEVYRAAKEKVGSGEQAWSPDSRETADHSAPYLVAATLMDGAITPRSFSETRLWDPELRALMQKVEVIENKEFTAAYDRLAEHRTRITVEYGSGGRLMGEAGGECGDLLEQLTDAQVVEKFRGLTEDLLGAKRVNAILERLWHLDEWKNVVEIPSAFILD